MNIRTLNTNEINEASRLIQKQWGTTYSMFFVEEASKLMKESSSAVYGKFSSTGSLEGVGMVTKDQIDYSLWGITWLVVCEELRGRGIGSELLLTLEGFAAVGQCSYPTKDCLVLLTTTIPDFYTKRGYQIIREWRDTTLMIKDLTDSVV